MPETSEPRQRTQHLYVHIPFCPTKCSYCGFVTHVGSSKFVGPYVEALCGEMSIRSADLAGPLDTIYLGGGTPSMLPPDQVRSILTHASDLLGLAPTAELCMEAHPGTVTQSALDGFRSAGINRLSLGVESLNPQVLARLGRHHDPARVADVLGMARRAAFRSVNLDLMYGLPGQDASIWRETLLRLLAMEPDHVSLYPLSVEPGTVFSLRQSRSQLDLPPDETVVEMYDFACGFLGSAGFEHYEVANWALPGHRSRHNMAYWTSRPFLAVGVGAHGYLHRQRYVNIRGVRRYIDAVTAGQPVTHSAEHVDRQIELDEYLMLRLRLLTDGVLLSNVRTRFGKGAACRVREVAASLPDDIEIDGERVRLRESAVPTANRAWAEFMGLLEGESDRGLDLVS